ncbi:Clp protease N-terminal domain-containing protein [Chlorogloeopsis fritschii PCC 9212]|uniref:Clp protease N-terminal domain-containing protein n=1 Tax=Chlorogloeopsis fritschii TaxID=1124 RepID=UPI00370D6D18
MKNRLRILRTEHNWSQAELAERLGVSRQTINAIETGKYDPSLPLAFQIAQLFDSSIEEIFFPEEGAMFLQPQSLKAEQLLKSPFVRFTPKAVRVIELAQEESRRLGHNFVGTEQILIGLILEGTGIAAEVLRTFGVTLENTRAEVEKIIGRGFGIFSVGIPFTPKTKLMLDFAVEESDTLGHYYIDTESLLLALLRVTDGLAVKVLKKQGVDLEHLRLKVLEVAPRGSDIQIGKAIAAQIKKGGQYLGETPIDFTSGEISARFCALLFAWVEPRKLGHVIGSSTGFQLPNGDVLAPRISFVLRDRLKRAPRVYPELVPDLVVEIKSAFDQFAPLQEKIQRFLELGVQVGLLINPDERTLAVYRANNQVTELTDEDKLAIPELLPEWELSISQLWPPAFK